MSGILHREILTAEFFGKLQGPCLYAWKRRDEWLYVGMSVVGIGRIFTHDVLGKVETMLPEDEIIVWFFDKIINVKDLAVKETELIRKYKPKHNSNGIPVSELKKRKCRAITCPKCQRIFMQNRWWQKHCHECG